MKKENVVDTKDLKQWASDLSDKMSDQVSRLGSEIKRYSLKGKDATSEVVQDHPLKSVGVALACGVILGYLLGRK